jgi:hypothetical protein
MGIRKARSVAVAIGLGMCFALIAAVPAMADPGAIEGRVTEPTEGEGQAEIEVCAIPASPAASPTACVFTEDGSGLGPRGHYEIAGLEPGNYKLKFTPPPESQYVYQYFQSKLRLRNADPAEVESAGITGNKNAVLQIGGRVAGKVTDTSGVALEKIDVCIFNPAVLELGTYCTKTVANGKYEVIGLPGSNYVAYFKPDPDRNIFGQYFSGKATEAAANQFLVLTGEETPGIDAAMEVGLTLEGTVVEAGGGALSGIRVCALDAATAAELRCLFSEHDGSYEIRGLHRGQYVVSFSAARPGVLSGEDAFVRQYYEDKPTFAAADRIEASVPGLYQDIDAHLVRGPETFPDKPVANPPAPLLVAPVVQQPQQPKPLICKKPKRKKVVDGKPRCVKVKKKKGSR